MGQGIPHDEISATEQELEALKGVRAGRVGGTDRAPNHINLSQGKAD
jgi:hypothetical protein